MSFNLGRAQNMGFQLAISHAVMDEAQKAHNGIPRLAEAGLTHGEMVATAQRWLSQTQCGDEAEAWAMLAFVAAAFAGAVQVAEEASPYTGEPCTNCDGRGFYQGWPHTTCPTCKGSGSEVCRRVAGAA